MEGQKEELELKMSSTTSVLTQKSEEVFLLREQISKQDLEIQNLKAASQEAKAHAESLQQELESSQVKLAGLEHLKTLQPELDELRKHTKQKEEEVSYLSGQLSEKEQTLTKVQAEMMDQEHLIRDLHTQLEMQAKEHEEQLKQFQVEVCELKQKSEEVEEEAKAKQQVHRKLQAALISRKAALKENKNLQEELSSARDAVAHLTKSLADVENQVSVQNKEKDAFLGKLALLQEERDKLVVEMDKCLLENQSLGGSCESLKLALEGHIDEKEKLMKELESLRCSNIAESTEWQEKHKELQKEYEVLLQSYENTSNEVESFQHVVASVRQDKEELHGKLRSTETDKREMEKQLQDAEQEMEQMKEKVKKFAKSKQQKILKLEEENDRLRAEAQALGGAKESMDALLSSNYSLKEELERVKLEYKTLSKEFGALMAEKSILSEEIQDLKLQREESVLKQASLEATEKFHKQKHVITEEETQALAGKSQEQDTQSVSVKLEHLEGLLSANGAKPGTRETLCSRDDSNDHLLQLEQLKGRISELEMEKQSDRELRQTLEKEKNALLSQISAKDGELKLREEEVTNINTLNQQIQEELSQVTKLKAKAEEEKYILEERLTDQLAERNVSIGKYDQDVADAQIKNEQLESEMQNLKKCMSDSEEEKQQLVTEKTKVESEIRKEYLEKKQGGQKGPRNRRHAKELQGLLRGKQLQVTQLQKDCLRYQERTSTLEKTVKAQLKEMEGQKEELELKMSSTTSELTPKSEEVFLSREQISKQDLEIQNLKAASHEAKAHAESLQQELESSQLKLAGLEHLKALQPELDELQKHTKQKEEEVSYLSGQLKRLTDQLAERNVSIGKYDQDVADAQIKNEQLESEMQNLKKCMSDSEEEKQQLVTEKTKVESEIRKEYLEKKQGGQKGPRNRRHAKELQGLLRGKQLQVTQLQKDCLRYQERTSTLEKTVKAQLKEMEGQKEELELKMSSTTSELTPKSEEVFLLREQISKQDLEIQNLKAASHEAKAHAESLQQELESSQLKLAGLEHLKTLQPELDELQKHTKQKEEEVSYLSGQLSEKEQTLTKVQAEMMDQEHLIRDLHTQLEMQAKEHEEQLKQFQVEVCELKQKSEEVEEEAKAKQQVHRKLQAALISRKAALKENKNLQEELSSARDAVAHLTKSLTDVENQVSVQNKEKDAFLGKLALLQEERDKLVEMDKCLLENQSLGGSCESLKLALEGHIEEKEKLMKELESLRYHNSTNELAKLESELKSLKDLSTDLNESLEKCKENKESLEGIIKQQEADIQNCKFNYEQLKTDLKASRELTGRLQDEIIMNEQKVISLLSGKEAAIQAAVAELHQQHHQETKKLENLLSQMEEENVALEEENKKAVEKTNQLMETLENIKKENLEQKAQLDSFVKSMSSLQDDRDRIISDYQQLEDRHFSIILEKDQLIQEVAVENNKLKEEIRWLRNHMDDLNSENAKLDAQLIQYRQDLNQLKEKLKGSEEARQSLQWSSDALQGEKRGLSTEIESLKRQVTALQEVGTLGAFPLTTTASFENAMSSIQKDRDRLVSVYFRSVFEKF
ncbi:Golgin subfamily B member 1 [Lemmus lemmus]